MHTLNILRILSILTMIFSLTMLPPVIISFIYQDGESIVFIKSFFILIGSSSIIWFITPSFKKNLRTKEAVLLAVLFWVILGASGALPLILSNTLNLNVASAFFESFSGLTTTGATILSNLDTLPKAILFYRQMLQWFGGIGIIVLAIAITPILGIGSAQLYKTEITGPEKNSKLTPQIKETAQFLLIIYISLTFICSIGLYLAGMNYFDALSHAMSTISIGGFSTHDDSIGYFQSEKIEFVIIIFMIIASMNFRLHFSLTGKNTSLKAYHQDSELKVFLIIQLSLCLITLATIYLYDNHFQNSFIDTMFNTISIATTTGFTTQGWSLWPIFLTFLLIIASCIGGCSGSMAGGMKVMRIYLLIQQGLRELYRSIHPRAIYLIKYKNKQVNRKIIDSVWGFFVIYVFIFVVGLLSLLAFGVEPVTAFSSIISSLNNLGPALGDNINNYQTMTDPVKWILILTMLLGRLELLTLLVILTPTFWKS